jgi:farnesyl diphosphate synthase
MLDLEKAKQKISKEEVARLHRLKTGELFMAATESGAILGRATVEERQALRYYAHDLGLAFQIKDDILDHEPTKTNSQENASIVDIIGLADAEKYLELLRTQSVEHLKIFGDKARLLIELAEFVVIRSK